MILGYVKPTRNVHGSPLRANLIFFAANVTWLCCMGLCTVLSTMAVPVVYWYYMVRNTYRMIPDGNSLAFLG